MPFEDLAFSVSGKRASNKQISSGALIHFHFRVLADKWNSIQMAVNANLKLKLKGFVGECWLL